MVQEYLAELNDLFNTIGLLDEHKKVHKLWNGLNRKIQKGLWREKLNPEFSTYEEVANAAELIEIIKNVNPNEQPRKKEKVVSGNKPGNNGNFSGSSNRFPTRIGKNQAKGHHNYRNNTKNGPY